MTVRATRKRDAAAEGEESAYNGAVAGFLERLVAGLAFVDGELLGREEREKVNGLVIALYAEVENAAVKRMVRAVNRALCAKDASLVLI